MCIPKIMLYNELTKKVPALMIKEKVLIPPYLFHNCEKESTRPRFTTF